VVLSAALVSVGVPIADPVIAIVITAIILRITWQSWLTVTGRTRSH
jgi:divalent metal cation (Fe/Co/Zn/Cd) transporter